MSELRTTACSLLIFAASLQMGIQGGGTLAHTMPHEAPDVIDLKRSVVAIEYLAPTAVSMNLEPYPTSLPNDPIGLTPCDSALVGDSEYEHRLNNQFLRGHCIDTSTSWEVMQAYIIPSFDPEWLVSIYEHRDHTYEVELIILNSNLFHDNQENTPIAGTNMGILTYSSEVRYVAHECYRKPMPAHLARLVQGQWKSNIFHARYGHYDDRWVIDGTSYVFQVEYDDLFNASACAYAPEDGSEAQELADIALLLCEYAYSADESMIMSLRTQIAAKASRHYVE